MPPLLLLPVPSQHLPHLLPQSHLPDSKTFGKFTLRLLLSSMRVGVFCFRSGFFSAERVFYP
jgi:hypothetical protein